MNYDIEFWGSLASIIGLLLSGITIIMTWVINSNVKGMMRRELSSREYREAKEEYITKCDELITILKTENDAFSTVTFSEIVSISEFIRRHNEIINTYNDKETKRKNKELLNEQYESVKAIFKRKETLNDKCDIQKTLEYVIEIKNILRGN